MVNTADNEESLFTKVWRVIYPPLIYMLIQSLASLIITGVVSVYYIGSVSIDTENYSSIVNEMFQELSYAITANSMYILMAAAVVSIPIFIHLMLSDMEQRRGISLDVKNGRINPALFLLIIPFGIAFMMADNMIISAFSALMPESYVQEYNYYAEITSDGVPVYITLLVSGVLAPVAEELVFRGLAYKRCREYTNMYAAAVISALIFGVAHGNWIQGPYAFLIGLALVFVYEKYRTIAAPVIFHIAINIFATLSNYFGWFQGEVSMGIYLSVILVMCLLAVFFALLILKYVGSDNKDKDHRNIG